MAYAFGAPSIVQDGLVFYVDAANKDSYVTSSLDTFSLINPGITGSLKNGTSFTFDNAGVWNFSTDDYIELNDGDTINGKTSISLSWWVNIIAGDNYDGMVCTRNGNDYLLTYIDLVSGDDFAIRIQQRAASGGGYSYTTSPTLTKGNWYNVTCTGTTGAKWDLYINGSNSGQTQYGNNIASLAQSDNFYIGTDDKVSGRYLFGSMGPVLIYDKKLSSQEVLQNYNALKGRFI